MSFLPSDAPSHPGDGNICYSDCQICFGARVDEESKKLPECEPEKKEGVAAPALPSRDDLSTATNTASSVSPLSSTITTSAPVKRDDDDDGAEDDDDPAIATSDQLNLNVNSTPTHGVERGAVNDGFDQNVAATTATNGAATKATNGAASKATNGAVSKTATTTTTTSTGARRPTSVLDLLPKRTKMVTKSPASPASEADWISVRGKFIGVNCIMMSARYE